jgi:hypothetical protein
MLPDASASASATVAAASGDRVETVCKRFFPTQQQS